MDHKLGNERAVQRLLDEMVDSLGCMNTEQIVATRLLISSDLDSWAKIPGANACWDLIANFAAIGLELSWAALEEKRKRSSPPCPP